jgi:hypothetical protein
VIQSLRETIGADREVVNTFEVFRKKRNITGYERIGLVSEADARAMRSLAVRLRDQVVAWVKKHHPDLLAR